MTSLFIRFLWRKNATFAISKHYRRFDVFVEAEANKAAGKYDNASIDFQVDFYKNEGLTPYSVAKLPITSGMSLLPYSFQNPFYRIKRMFYTQTILSGLCRRSGGLCHFKRACSH